MKLIILFGLSISFVFGQSEVKSNQITIIDLKANENIRVMPQLKSCVEQPKQATYVKNEPDTVKVAEIIVFKPQSITVIEPKKD